MDPQEMNSTTQEQQVDTSVTGQTAPTTQPEPRVLDHDELELQQAQDALKAEEQGTTVTETTQVATATAPAAATPPATTTAPAADTQKPEEHKGNPTAAIIALRKRLQDETTQRLILQGQVQAFSSMAQQTAKPAEEVIEEVDPLFEVRSHKQALAEKFDAGEISARDWESQRQSLEDQEWEIRAAKMQPVTAPAQPATDLQLETATVALETQYPVLSILTVEDLQPLEALARRQAAREGKPIQSGALGTLDLRTRIARLAQQEYGGGDVQSPPVSTTTTALSPEAQAREKKLALSQSMPADVTTMGSAASAASPSESELVARMQGMTEDEELSLLNSMPGLRLKILGG
jgi:hypothetical protein